MTRSLWTFCAPAYLLLCIVIGGSQQGTWANAALQIVAVGLLFGVWLSGLRARSKKVPIGLTLSALAVIALQLVPLPPAVWSTLPGRELLVEGYAVLELQPPWLPLSQTPYVSIAAAFALLPVLAMLATVQLQDNDRVLTGALLVGTVAAIILGQLQVGVTDHRWHFYEITNPGPVGFFANINHMATLMLASIPFFVALLGPEKDGRPNTHNGVQLGLAGVGIAVLLIGIILNGSLAGLLLVGPVLLASGLLLPIGWKLRRFVLPLTGLAFVGAVYALSADPLDRVTGNESWSVESRQQIWATTLAAIDDTFPFGTGLGSFQTVYAAYENQSSVGATYVNHAHNDYLQVALELGAPGIMLVALFLIWWAVQSVRIWRSNESRSFQRAATIASSTVLAHSAVDYPLRTAAIAAIFGMCIGLMVRQPAVRPKRMASRPRVAQSHNPGSR